MKEIEQEERRLPSHIERAARRAYAAGHEIGRVCGLPETECACTRLHGLEAFRASLEHDTAEATAEGNESIRTTSRSGRLTDGRRR